MLKTDTRPEVRREAALALGSIGPPAAVAVPVLKDALGRSEATVAAGAAYAPGTHRATGKAGRSSPGEVREQPLAFLRTVAAWAWAKVDPHDEAGSRKPFRCWRPP